MMGSVFVWRSDARQAVRDAYEQGRREVEEHYQRDYPFLHRLVLVATKDHRSFIGVLVGWYPDVLVLRHAETLPERDELAGDLVVPRDNVSYVQQDVPESARAKLHPEHAVGE